ncbi:MAG: hypothetical protein NT002_00065, partial [candidate division Zixibacteria bacterium]|nr:hypothetical protein [candidate division Zixibacteria bacterium]
YGLSYKILVSMLILIPLIIMSVPTYLLVRNGLSEKQILVCRLTPISRAADSTVFLMDNNVDSIQFELDYPVPANGRFLYNITIHNLDGENIFGQANLTREKAFAIKAPARYFKPGFYILTAEEFEQGRIRRTIAFPFRLKMSN